MKRIGSLIENARTLAERIHTAAQVEGGRAVLVVKGDVMVADVSKADTASRKHPGCLLGVYVPSVATAHIAEDVAWARQRCAAYGRL